MTKDIKKEIEEILREVWEDNMSFESEGSEETIKNAINQLSTLIQEEREEAYNEGYEEGKLLDTKVYVGIEPMKKIQEEAVRGFVREFNNKCLHDSINESYSYPLEEIPNVVYSFVEEYLSSIGKDE